MLAYYAATAAFLLLDLTLGLNVRIAFLQDSVPLRAGYYGVCFACLFLIVWRPDWTAVVTAFESIVTLAALIVSFGVRVMLISDAVLEGSDSLLTVQEVVNFLMSGGIAYVAWARGIKELTRQ